MGFFNDLLNKIFLEALRYFGVLLVDTGKTLFFIERSISNIFANEKINSIYDFMCAFAISLIVLKMLKKGFMTYILWRDGDPDAPVQQTVVNFMLAVALAISFPTIYQWYAEVSLWLIETIINMSFDNLQVFNLEDAPLIAMTESLVISIIGLIYIIMLFVLYLQFFMRGAEMLVLRLGFPLACLGLLDSDNGVFTATVKIFIQTSLTATIQLFLMNFSAVIFVNSRMDVIQWLFSISCCMAAFGAPRLLQFITLPQGGGGGMYKVTSTVHMVSMVKGMLPR